MKEKIVKCQKEYKCDQCGEPIKKGEYAHFGKARQPRFRNTDCDEQIGVEYVAWRFHANEVICQT